MKTDPQTIILLVVGVWTITTTLLAWLLLRANKLHRRSQRIKFPYEVEMEENEN